MENQTEVPKEITKLTTKAAASFKDYKYYEAIDQYKELIALCEDKMGASDIETAKAIIGHGKSLWRVGKYKDARSQLEKAIEISKKHFGGENFPFIADIYYYLANAWCEEDNWEETNKWNEKALAIYKESTNDSDNGVIKVLVLKVHILGGLRKIHQALALGEEIRKRIEENLGEESREMGDLLYAEGRAYYHRPNPAKSVEKLEQCLTVRKKVFGQHSTEVAEGIQYLALALLTNQKVAEAMTKATEAIELRREIYGGDNHREVGESIVVAAPIYLGLGQVEKCFEESKAAQALFEKMNGKAHYDYASARQLDGMIQAMIMQSDKSKESYEEALAIKKEIYGENSLAVSDLYDDWGNTHVQLQRFDEAKELFQKSMDIKHASIPETDPRHAECYFRMAAATKDEEARFDYLQKGTNSFIVALKSDPFTAYESEAFLRLIVQYFFNPKMQTWATEINEQFSSWTDALKTDNELLIFIQEKLSQVCASLGKTIEDMTKVFTLFKVFPGEVKEEAGGANEQQAED